MTWLLWLLPPVAATLLAAAWSWLRSRPPRRPTGRAAMREHERYLEALGAYSPRPEPPARSDRPD